MVSTLRALARATVVVALAIVLAFLLWRGLFTPPPCPDEEFEETDAPVLARTV
jgi:hypothetical protein